MEGRRDMQRGLVCVLLAHHISCSSSFHPTLCLRNITILTTHHLRSRR